MCCYLLVEQLDTYVLLLINLEEVDFVLCTISFTTNAVIHSNFSAVDTDC